MSSDPFEIRSLPVREIERLRGLWLELRSHHETVAPQLPAHVSEDDSWERRRALYETWLAEPDAFALVAAKPGEDEPLGYALVSIDGPDDTWETGGRRAELQTLAVAPHARGDGVGGRLMDAVGAQLDRLGIPGLFVAVVATNTDAIRFYERRDFVPCLVSYYGRPVLREPRAEHDTS